MDTEEVVHMANKWPSSNQNIVSVQKDFRFCKLHLILEIEAAFTTLYGVFIQSLFST